MLHIYQKKSVPWLGLQQCPTSASSYPGLFRFQIDLFTLVAVAAVLQSKESPEKGHFRKYNSTVMGSPVMTKAGWQKFLPTSSVGWIEELVARLGEKLKNCNQEQNAKIRRMKTNVPQPLRLFREWGSNLSINCSCGKCSSFAYSWRWRVIRATIILSCPSANQLFGQKFYGQDRERSFAGTKRWTGSCHRCHKIEPLGSSELSQDWNFAEYGCIPANRHSRFARRRRGLGRRRFRANRVGRDFRQRCRKPKWRLRPRPGAGSGLVRKLWLLRS